MKAHLSAITLGVNDFERAKKFYKDLGWKPAIEAGQWVAFDLGDGSSQLGIYPRQTAAGEAGVSAEGTGFRAFALHYVVGSSDRVDAVIAEAEKAGGTVVKTPQAVQWGYFGYFADPDGNLWKVAAGQQKSKNAAE